MVGANQVHVWAGHTTPNAQQLESDGLVSRCGSYLCGIDINGYPLAEQLQSEAFLVGLLNQEMLFQVLGWEGAHAN